MDALGFMKQYMWKLIVLILLIVATVLLCGTTRVTGKLWEVLIYFYAAPTYVLVITAVLLAIIIDKQTDFVEMVYFIAGAILNLAAGIIAIIFYFDRSGHAILLVFGALCLASGIIMCIDTCMKCGKCGGGGGGGGGGD